MLAGGAPEEVASFDDAVFDGGAADVAGVACPPVDVDFPAVVVFAGWSSHGVGCVFGSDGVDAAGVDACAHEGFEVVPDVTPGGCVDFSAGGHGVDA